MRFTKDHEWVMPEADGTAFVGISAYAAEALGDVVYVDLPEVGKIVSTGDAFCVVESVKAASDVYAPVSGEIIEVNELLSGSPETVNAVPEAGGWIAKIRLGDAAELEALMDRAAYEAYLTSL